MIHGSKAWRLLVFSLPIVFALPRDFFQGNWTLCLFKNLTGLDCYGCGITRAIYFALHFRFEEAYAMNPLVIALLPILMIIYLRNFNDIMRIYLLRNHLNRIANDS